MSEKSISFQDELELEEVVRNNIPRSCGLIVYSERYNDYNKEEYGTETFKEVELWRLEDMLDTVKRALYRNNVSSVYTSFGGFNQVSLRCYY